MAQYEAHRNKGYNNQGTMEPGYGGWNPAVIGYAATSERHITTEQVVEYGSFPMRHSPNQMELRKNVHGAGDNPLFRVQGPTHHERPRRGDKSSPKFSQTKGSPRYNIVHRDNDDESDDDDDDDVYEEDVICENGFCYPNPKHMKEKNHEREKPKGNGYAHGTHTVPHSKKDPHHETTYNPHGTYYEKPKGSTYSPPSYTAPLTTQPRKDPYNETSNNPPPIKTRSDHTTIKGGDYLGEKGRNSPVSAPRSPFSTSSPRKDHKTFDNTEAPRRHGQYKGTIGDKEAAKKYHGVLANY